jgi:hypothetical protein
MPAAEASSGHTTGKQLSTKLTQLQEWTRRCISSESSDPSIIDPFASRSFLAFSFSMRFFSMQSSSSPLGLLLSEAQPIFICMVMLQFKEVSRFSARKCTWLTFIQQPVIRAITPCSKIRFSRTRPLIKLTYRSASIAHLFINYVAHLFINYVLRIIYPPRCTSGFRRRHVGVERPCNFRSL